MSTETTKKDLSWILQLHLIVIANYTVNILDSCSKLGQTKRDEILSRPIKHKIKTYKVSYGFYISWFVGTSLLLLYCK